MLRILIYLFVVLLNFVFAQTSSHNEGVSQQLWVDYNTIWYLSTDFTFSGTAGIRTDIPTTWKKILIESAIGYAPTPLFDFLNKSQQQLIGGFNFYYSYNNDKPNSFEFRPYQGYRISWPNVTNLKILHYLRLEERLEFTAGEDNNEFQIRARYKLEAIIHWTNHLVDFAAGLYIPMSVEFFSNLYSTKQYNNSIRLTPGIGFSSESRWKIQFNLSYQYSRYEEELNIGKNTIIYRLRYFVAI